MHGAHLPPKVGIRCGADAVRAGVRAGVAGAGAAAGRRRVGEAVGRRAEAGACGRRACVSADTQPTGGRAS